MTGSVPSWGSQQRQGDAEKPRYKARRTAERRKRRNATAERGEKDRTREDGLLGNHAYSSCLAPVSSLASCSRDRRRFGFVVAVVKPEDSVFQLRCDFDAGELWDADELLDSVGEWLEAKDLITALTEYCFFEGGFRADFEPGFRSQV